MIVSATSRVLSALPTFLESQTSSHNRHGSTSTASGSYDAYVSINGDVSVTVSNATGHFSASYVDASHTYHQSAGGANGATTSANATMYSTSSFQSSFSSYSSVQMIGTEGSTTSESSSDSSSDAGGDSSTFHISDTITVSLTSSSEASKIVSTDTTTTTTHYIVSGHTLTTATTSSDIVTSTITSTTHTFDSYTTSATTYDNYIQWGLVISADTEWLFLPYLSTSSPNLVTDFASSYDGLTTIWPESVGVPFSFAEVADSSASSSTLEIAAGSVVFTYENIIYTATTDTTLTSGDYLSRSTYTTSLYKADTTSDTTYVGNEAQTIVAISTHELTLSTYSAQSFIQKQLYSSGESNLSTSTVLGVYSFFSTTTSYSILANTAPGSSSAITYATDDIENQGWGATVEGTDVSYKNLQFIPFGESPSALTPVAPYGCFVSPHDLRSAGNPYAFGSNLSFESNSIPYGELKSVFSNAQVPYPVAFSITGTNSHTYSYSWSSDTLQVTEQSTALVGTKTQTHTSTSSGTFSTMGSESHFYKLGGSVYGGFQPIESASESVTFYPRAVLGTSIDISGGSTTYRELVTSFEQSTLEDTVIVEAAIPAYRVWTYLGAAYGGDQPYLVFPRN